VTYTTRLIWPTKGCSQFDIEDARSQARALQRRLEEMIMLRHSPAEIHRLAIHCKALALVGGDSVVAQNAREIADRFSPRQHYSRAQRRAIHDKALAALARLARKRGR